MNSGLPPGFSNGPAACLTLKRYPWQLDELAHGRTTQSTIFPERTKVASPANSNSTWFRSAGDVLGKRPTKTPAQITMNSARGLYDTRRAGCCAEEAAFATVRSGPKGQREAQHPEETRRSRPTGRNTVLGSTVEPEGGHWGGPRFTPQNVTIGRRGGKPLAIFLRGGVLGVAVLVALAAWVATPVSAIALVEVAWWSWEDAASTPLDTTMQESGMVAEAAGGVESPMIATPQ